MTKFIRSLGVCLLACAISLVVLYWLSHALETVMPGYFRVLMVRHIDARVVGFAMLVVVTASLVAGGLPAWRATRTSLMTVMQREGGQPAHTRRNRIGQAVIASEAALGVVLVLAAAMVVRNFVTLLTTDAGFRPANLHVLRVQPTGERRGGDDVAELARYRGILEIVRQLPGVESAGAADSMPAEASAPMTGFEATLGGRFGLWQILASPFGVTAATVSPAGASIRSALEQPRTQALMFGTFAVIALLLAALGLYAVTSFDVALRRYELGIRSSLGATAAMLRRAVAVDALRPVLVGTATGLVASYWISRWVETLVYDVDARDPWTFTSVAIVLVLTAIAASWFPARRAARIDPADVLRTL